MIARALRAAALLAIIGTAGCNRTTIVYPPPGSERPEAIPDPRCSPDWRRIAAGRFTVGQLKAWVDERERDRPCNGLALRVHRAAAVVDWRTTDRSVGEGEIVRQVLVEVDRADPAGRLLRLHAMVGAGGAGPVTLLIEGPQGPQGEPGKDAEPTGGGVVTRPGGSGSGSDPPVANPPETGGTGSVSGPEAVTDTTEVTIPVDDTVTNRQDDNTTDNGNNDGNATTGPVEIVDGGNAGGRARTTTIVVSAAAGAGLTYALSALGLLGGPTPLRPGGRAANLARRIEPDGGELDDDEPDADSDTEAGTDADGLWDSRLRVRSAGFAPGP